ncbi:MAG: uracil-DNA glycosylase [Pseudomonadota bacterium]
METGDLTDRKALAALLAWYEAMGATDAVAETSEDWMSRPDRPPPRAEAWLGMTGDSTRSAPPPPPPSAPVHQPPSAASIPTRAPTPPPATPQAPVSPRPIDRAAPGVDQNALDTARALAAASNSLADLKTALEGFDGCPLKRTAKSLCFARGADQARLMVIGEGPGREEDLSGTPFVGRAGQLLDKMLASIGLDDSSVHVTNVIYWRPPGNRTPTELEIMVCRPFLERQIELVGPDVILALGGSAAKTLLETKSGIMRLRGQWSNLELGGRARAFMPTLHPAYLLRTPAAKHMAWRDLLEVQSRLSSS